MTHVIQSLSFLSALSYKLVLLFSDVMEEYKKARAKAHTIKELSKLKDKELRDIGLHRGEIHDVAHRIHYHDN
jgi:uncharacterized protein YjiS (DUF1127 family)